MGVRLQCDCGNEYTVALSTLVAGLSSGCGCKRGNPGCRSDPVSAARNRILATYTSNARQRGLVFGLTDEEFFRLISLDCFYCGHPPAAIQKLPRRVKHETRRDYYDSGFASNGLDRVDNDLGYTPENVVPCCSNCNRAKRDMPYDDFLAWIARLTEYHFFHPDLMPSLLLRKAQ